MIANHIFNHQIPYFDLIYTSPKARWSWNSRRESKKINILWAYGRNIKDTDFAESPKIYR